MTNTVNYRGRRWEGIHEQDDECFKVSMTDATFQRHLKVYLENRGVPTLTYLELLAYVDTVLEQRVQAAKQLRQLDHWRDCDDPEVRIIPPPIQAEILKAYGYQVKRSSPSSIDYADYTDYADSSSSSTGSMHTLAPP